MSVMSPVTLTEEQSNAVTRIMEFWHDSKRMEFKLGGLAGTGKTTIIKTVKAAVEDAIVNTRTPTTDESSDDEPDYDDDDESQYTPVGVCSFTGKAVSVLRRKGVYAAQTLHSMMYYPVIDNATKEMHFEKREQLEGDPDLVIYDEASMCNKDMYNDLTSFGKKILWVGDPGQLEPVGEDINLMSKCDIVLEKIHRQAAESPILQLAHQVRFNQPFLNGRWEGGDSILQCVRNADGEKLLNEADIVIVAFNKDRVRFNAEIRRQRGLYGLICPTEKIIVLKNDKTMGIYNGQIMTIRNINKHESSVVYVDAEDETGQKYHNLPIGRPPLEQGALWDPKKYPLPRGTAHVDYGYVVTCHKSQGSEWNKVLVFEPGWWGKPGEKPMWEPARWKYTAVTRAAKHLIYCRR